MSRLCILTAAQHDELLAFQDDQSDLIRLHTLSRDDLTFVRAHRGGHNQLGCCLALLSSVPWSNANGKRHAIRTSASNRISMLAWRGLAQLLVPLGFTPRVERISWIHIYNASMILQAS